jgi:hypothetical protein
MVHSCSHAKSASVMEIADYAGTLTAQDDMGYVTAAISFYVTLVSKEL